MPALAWKKRDIEVVETVLDKVPFLSLEQVARTWWPGRTTNAARSRLRQLVAGGYLWTACVPAHPELPLTDPVIRWHPGDERPALASVAHHLEHRWTEPARPTHIYRATKKAARKFGGDGGRLGHQLHVNHDLHVATVYLLYRSLHPEFVERWVSEHHLAASRRHQKLPDAALRDARGRVCFIIEGGGAYRLRHLQPFHDDCERRGLPYEVW